MICICCNQKLTLTSENKKNNCSNCGITFAENIPFLTCPQYTKGKCLNCLKNGLLSKKKLNCTACLNVKKKKKYCLNCKICKKGHNLGKVRNLKVFGNAFSSYNNNVFCCDLCKRTKKNESYVLHCFACKFDACEACVKNYEKNFYDSLVIFKFKKKIHD